MLLATMLVMGPQVGAIELVPALALGGVGLGLVFAPLFDIILVDLDDAQVGSGSGLLSAVQQYGSAVGAALIGASMLGGRDPGEVVRGAVPVVAACMVAFGLASVGCTFLPRGRSGVTRRG